jgi:hypothetical protein
MKMKKITIATIIVVILTIVSIITVSCESNTYSEISVVTNPTYSKNIGPLFSSKCASCHSPGGTDQAPYLTNYDEVKESIVNGNTLCLLEDPTVCFFSANTFMPPTGKLPQTTIDMIKLWRDQGYPN